MSQLEPGFERVQTELAGFLGLAGVVQDPRELEEEMGIVVPDVERASQVLGSLRVRARRGGEEVEEADRRGDGLGIQESREQRADAFAVARGGQLVAHGLQILDGGGALPERILEKPGK